MLFIFNSEISSDISSSLIFLSLIAIGENLSHLLFDVESLSLLSFSLFLSFSLQVTAMWMCSVIFSLHLPLTTMETGTRATNLISQKRRERREREATTTSREGREEKRREEKGFFGVLGQLNNNICRYNQPSLLSRQERHPSERIWSLTDFASLCALLCGASLLLQPPVERDERAVSVRIKYKLLCPDRVCLSWKDTSSST